MLGISFFGNFVGSRFSVVWFIPLMIFTALALGACSDDATDPFTTYDDFTGTDGDAPSTTKWNQSVSTGNSMSISSNALALSWAGNGGNSNGRLFMADAGSPTTTTSIEAKMTVDTWTASSETGNVRLRLAGTFYNTALSSGTAGDFTSDIFAFLQVQGLSGTTLNVVGGVVRCDDSTCSSTTSIIGGDTLTTVEVGAQQTYRISYDSTANEFTYYVGGTLLATIDMVNTDSGRDFPYVGPSIAGNIQVGVRGSGITAGALTASIDDFRCIGCVVP